MVKLIEIGNGLGLFGDKKLFNNQFMVKYESLKVSSLLVREKRGKVREEEKKDEKDIIFVSLCLS